MLLAFFSIRLRLLFTTAFSNSARVIILVPVVLRQLRLSGKATKSAVATAAMQRETRAEIFIVSL
jgi:hypothetical protein